MRIVAAGLPNSGKSSFIAALTHLLNAKEVDTRLTLASLSGDEKQLRTLEHRWLGAEPLPRTQRANEHWGRFSVLDTVTGEEAEFLVPDMRGELFEQPATIGGCQRALWEALVGCDAIILFTNVDRPDDDLTVCDMADVVGAVAGEEQQISNSRQLPFQASSIPEEPKLVELLQAVNRWPAPSKNRRLALVLSAWDVVSAEMGADPSSWADRHRPMLAQFLQENPGLWECRVYGVSALGGRLPQDGARLREIEVAGKRIGVVGVDVNQHDLTGILYWLMKSKVNG